MTYYFWTQVLNEKCALKAHSSVHNVTATLSHFMLQITFFTEYVGGLKIF